MAGNTVESEAREAMILKPLLLALFCAVLPLESRFERGHGK